MIFEKLELVNFKSHERSTIEFNHGITLIIGENGAGKSSIFEAITFALFSESQVNNIDLVRTNKGTPDKIMMEVKLTFMANSNRYRVERTITKKKDRQNSGARLYRITDVRDELITEGVTRVNSEIQMILSMNSKTFLNAIHIRQGEISSLIDETAAERKKLIGQLLRLDDLEKAHKQMPEVIKEYEFIKTDVSARILDENELKSELESNSTLKGEVEAQNVEFASNLEELKKDHELKLKEKENLDAQKQKLDQLKIKVQNDVLFKEKLKQTNSDLTKKLEEIKNNEEEMLQLKPAVEKLQIFRDFKDYLVKYNVLKKDETSKAEILDKINEYRNILESQKEAHDRYIELEGQIKEENLLKVHLESEIKIADELKTNIKKSQMMHEKSIVSMNKVYERCEAVLADYGMKDIKEKSLDEISQSVENLISKINDEMASIDSRINELNARIGSLRQEIKSSEKPLGEVKQLENKCPTCQSDISQEKKNQLIDSYESIISKSNLEIEKTSELIGDLKRQKSSNNDKIKVLDSLKIEISQNIRLPDEIERLEGEIKETEEKITELAGKEIQLQKTSEDINAKTDELKGLEEGHKRYVDAQTLLANQSSEDEIKNELSKISENLNEIETAMTALQQKDETLTADISQDRLDLEIRELSDKNKRYNNLEGSVKDKADYENKLKLNQEEIENKENEIGETAKVIESCSYDSEVHKSIADYVDESAVKINEISKNIAVNETRLQGFVEKITEITGKLEDNKIHKAKYDAVCKYLDILYDFKELYGKNGIQRELRAQSKPLIQKYTREFFEKFNFNYSDLKLSDEYDITIYGPDGEVKLNMVSGGEKIAIALSLRLGITQVMSKGNIETILLDEPTIHLDSFRRQELINVLRSMSVIPQMIIVTHDEELETAADSLIKVTKEDGISKVSDD